MQPVGVEPVFDSADEVLVGVGSGLPPAPVREFMLERAEKRLSRIITPAHPGSHPSTEPHRTAHKVHRALQRSIAIRDHHGTLFCWFFRRGS